MSGVESSRSYVILRVLNETVMDVHCSTEMEMGLKILRISHGHYASSASTLVIKCQCKVQSLSFIGGQELLITTDFVWETEAPFFSVFYKLCYTEQPNVATLHVPTIGYNIIL